MSGSSSLLLMGVGKVAVAGGTFPAGVSPWARYKANNESGSVGDPKVPQDISGNGRHMVQATGSKQPTLQTGPNGKLVYRWDNVDDECTLPNPSALTAATIFAVVKTMSDPATGSGAGIWRIGNAGGDYYPYTDGNLYIGAAWNDRQALGNPTENLATFNNFCVRAGTDWRAFINGTQFGATETTQFVAWGSAHLLGKNADGVYFPGDIAELIICSTALSTSDRQDVDAYIRAEYGTP